MKFGLWHSLQTPCMRIILSCQAGRRSLTGANRYQVRRSPASWVVPVEPKPLKWQMAQVGAGNLPVLMAVLVFDSTTDELSCEAYPSCP